MTTVLWVPTPLGEVQIEMLAAPEGAAPEAVAAKSGAWRIGDGELRVEVIPFVPALVPPRTVDGAIAVVARLAAVRATTPACVRAFLDRRPIAGGPAAGQGLVASTWTAQGHVLSIGTPDEERLSMLAAQDLGVPRRLADRWRGAAIRCVEGGLAVDVPGLLAGEHLALCIVLAWALDTPDAADATWFAVDPGAADLARWLGAR